MQNVFTICFILYDSFYFILKKIPLKNDYNYLKFHQGVLEDMTHFRAHLPTLMLVANYDAFAPSADFKVGFDVYGSGVVVLLNIMNEFQNKATTN